MNIGASIKRHWRAALAVAVLAAAYFYFTRVRVVGVVDASGDGMTINGRKWVQQ